MQNLKNGMNPVRFHECAPSSSLMIALIGMLIGVQDLGAITPIFALNATMNLPGIMMELHNRHTEETNWTAPVHGCIAGFIAWVVIMLFFESAVDSGSGNGSPPAFVCAIVPTLFVFASILAINMVLQHEKSGPWKDYLFGERVNIVLSPSARTVLCWPIWSSTLAPAERRPLLPLFAQPQFRTTERTKAVP